MPELKFDPLWRHTDADNYLLKELRKLTERVTRLEQANHHLRNALAREREKVEIDAA